MRTSGRLPASSHISRSSVARPTPRKFYVLLPHAATLLLAAASNSLLSQLPAFTKHVSLCDVRPRDTRHPNFMKRISLQHADIYVGHPASQIFAKGHCLNDSEVGIVTRLHNGRSEFDSRERDFYFYHVSVGSIVSSYQIHNGVLTSGVRRPGR